MTPDEKLRLFGPPTRLLVRLADIRRENGAQVREAISAEAVRDYAEKYRQGVELPPIAIFFDGPELRPDGACLRLQPGEVLRLADGFQRWAGAETAGCAELDAEVYLGDLRKAQLYAAQANAEHGVRRSDETVRRAVRTLLEDPEWSQWTDRAIALHVDCSPTTVGKQRRLLKGLDGREYNVGKQRQAAEEERVKKAVDAMITLLSGLPPR